MPDDPIPPAARARVARTPAPRLPGTYAANYGDDPNWQRGVAVLWTMFVLAALGEAANTALYYLRGGVGDRPPFDMLRLILDSALFIALWIGWKWVRWPLAAVNFFYGGWLVVWLIGSHAAVAAARAAAGEPAPGYGAASIPVLGTALVYLFSAGYLAFSADMLDFLRHRREEGRGWVLVPVAALVGGCLVLMFGSVFLYAVWIGLEEKSGGDFAVQGLRTMSSPWNAAAYEKIADPEYLKTWYEGDRRNTFANLAPLGPFQQYGHRYMAGTAQEDTDDGGFLLVVRCDLTPARFAHGHAHFGVVVAKHLFGSWKMRSFQVDDIQTDSGAPVPAH